MLFSETFAISYNISGTSFIELYIKMTISIRFYLSHGFLMRTDTPLDTRLTGFHMATV